MNPAYVVPRLVRHFLPERLVRYMLLRSVIIRPGLETVNPRGAVGQYLEVLDTQHMTLGGKRILVFGYGGRFDIGIGLLEAGAARVGLCDKYAHPDDRHNVHLVHSYPSYISMNGNSPSPLREHMQLVEGDVRDLPPPGPDQRYDLVISNSVYEHLEDPAGTTQALVRWTMPNGVHIHFVDLRDHFFQYPFEMLRYSENAWRRWLNPTSNHNRLRIWDYRRIFAASFDHVELDVLGRDAASFERVRRHLRPEFVSGNPDEDAVTLLRIVARNPRV